MSGVELSDGSVAKFCYDYVIPTAISTACHPFVCARTLMMLGHEFEPPTLGRNLFGVQRYMYPNVFNYRMCLLQLVKFVVGHLREDVGLLPVFVVGLPASVIGSAIKSSVCESYLREHVTGYMYKKSIFETEQGWEVFVQETCKLTAGRCLGLLVSYPFQVIMIRQIAQLVGKETIYSNILKAFVEINVNEGLPGLFGGLIPRLLGEVITVWLTAGMAYLVNKYLLPEDTDPFIKEQTPYIAGVSYDPGVFVHAPSDGYLYRDGRQWFWLVSCGAVQEQFGLLQLPFNKGKKPGQIAYFTLLLFYRQNAFMRGASLFFRYASGQL
ncbi:unnamed protein product [Taenia asiatica]|uniref:Mitochondrial carrier homolog 2 n=1 Tax=Taenia asiatica TaxID=60517 RepID=A0A0R3W3X3_TAEAS|nr:unnamed protein product [Taenia asiatica]